ncbi:molybdenum cofactor biosynthesis protein MoaE [Actinobacteria bacterium YIM 96077]|uniref:Molybdopterin synthase catalytic subunit 1 n=1 Tax=Phytoactinopolyspora halophila TaxID=1981511 RepID=A0A329R343_9ACTN|nr:molybdenum cofactor biosynthesis protein MoaE [Phytoactinopolyspora halophila]AYY11963.1 molybdenum cofactor biosynthesis protein MoaE [Actinobacteria bacterium YIM 96077]RAW18803.1 molybdenum cofactor biosynthesis protein MoaE [Phytoactinopolyspora halophila]
MDVIKLLGVREEALSVDEVLAAVTDSRAGGTDLFVGTVRELDENRPVTALEYEAHPMADRELRRVAETVAATIPVRALAAVHRVGHLRIGDIAVIAAASAEHRAEAFTACRKLIDDLKREVPIWKHQSFADGSTEWVGSP